VLLRIDTFCPATLPRERELRLVLGKPGPSTRSTPSGPFVRDHTPYGVSLIPPRSHDTAPDDHALLGLEVCPILLRPRALPWPPLTASWLHTGGIRDTP
jgi:hypothetical protein